MSKISWVFAINLITAMVGLCLAVLICVGIGMAVGDGKSVGIKMDQTKMQTPREVFMQAFGLYLIVTSPSWIFVYLGKSTAALTASAIPFVFALSILFLFRRAFS